jgi:transcriptional/translational regulatory protein YebC/TACO1
MTDNKDRTCATIRALISKSGGSFSRVQFKFDRKGLIIIKCNGRPFEQVLEEAIDLGAEDVQQADDGGIKVHIYRIGLISIGVRRS